MKKDAYLSNLNSENSEMAFLVLKRAQKPKCRFLLNFCSFSLHINILLCLLFVIYQIETREVAVLSNRLIVELL